ncbi:MAG: aminotransferase class I/II-fold pyridoxal phosphate-dependent enzyme [Cyclobacteriaceae bacterium]
MTQDRIYLSPPFVDEAEKQELNFALDSGWIAPYGPKIGEFQEALARRFGFANILCVSSGTAALHLAVKLCGVTNGDKVLVGSLTFVAAANAVLYEGGEPVFIDSEPESWNIDPDLLEQKLIDSQKRGEKIKGVIVTHIYGRPAQMQRIKSICVRYGVKLIEDAAEALGAQVEGASVGTFGDYAILSFNGNKIITASGGGALVCKAETDADKARFWASQSKDQAEHYEHSEVGYNYGFSNLLAGVGLAQLNKLDGFLSRKKEILDYYIRSFSDWDIFELDQSTYAGSNNWLSVFLIKNEVAGKVSPAELVAELEQDNIEARRFWKPLHQQPLFGYSDSELNGVSQGLFERGICLPCGVGLSSNDQDRVVEALRALFSRIGFLK